MAPCRSGLGEGDAVGQALAEGGPGGLCRDIDRIGVSGFGLGQFGGRENGQENEGFVVGIVSAVDGSGGDVGHFTGGKEALFGSDPLFGTTIEDVDDFFPMRVKVEGVAMAGSHVGADEKELFGGDEVRAAEPFVVGPGVDFADGVGDLNEAIGVGIGHV